MHHYSNPSITPSSSPYLERRAWSDRFLGDVQRILAPFVVSPAPLQADISQGIDLLTRPLSIGVRIRRHRYLEQFGPQLTLRASEMPKLIAGGPDYLFAGWASPDEERLAAWVILDVGQWRLWLVRSLWAGRRPWATCHNGDGSRFLVFDLASCRNAIVAADGLQLAQEMVGAA